VATRSRCRLILVFSLELIRGSRAPQQQGHRSHKAEMELLRLLHQCLGFLRAFQMVVLVAFCKTNLYKMVFSQFKIVFNLIKVILAKVLDNKYRVKILWLIFRMVQQHKLIELQVYGEILQMLPLWELRDPAWVRLRERLPLVSPLAQKIYSNNWIRHFVQILLL